RSRAYINGSPVPVGDVRELGDFLISIHSQHEHQALLKKEAQRDLLDSFAGAETLAGEVRRHWRQWQQARKAHEDALAKASEQGERQDLLRFQLEELDAFALGENELQELESEQKRLGNADALIRLCQQSLAMLYESDDGTVNDLLGQCSHWLGDASAEDTTLANVLSSVESARLQVEAAADDLRHYLDRLEIDPERLALVEERLGQAWTLARKHRVRPEELFAHHQRLREEAGTLEHYDEHLAELEAAARKAQDGYDKQARKLSDLRRKKAGELASGVLKHLKALGMAGPRMDSALQPGGVGAAVLDHIDLQFTANPGQPLKPLSKVASGGEL